MTLFFFLWSLECQETCPPSIQLNGMEHQFVRCGEVVNVDE